MGAFKPDLIIEATKVCDRKCVGCYAPNDFGRFGENSAAASVNIMALQQSLHALNLNKRLELIAVRGGEPTLHPQLEGVLDLALEFAKQVAVETHGRWLLYEDVQSVKTLSAVKKQGVVVKISFDRMHGLSRVDLRKMTLRLDAIAVPWWIAITELNSEAMVNTRNQMGWVADSQIIFQNLATARHELIEPKYGVISVNAQLKSTVTVKASFVEAASA